MALSMSSKIVPSIHKSYSRLLCLRESGIYLNKLNNICVAASSSQKDPAELFFRNDVQKLLKSVTGFNLDKVFKEQFTKIRPPKYKLLTDEELVQEQAQAIRRGRKKLQMPPVIKTRSSEEVVLSNDTEIDGYDTSKFVFTDITYGIKDKKRTIVVREPSGKLRLADSDERERVLNVYFPQPGRMYHIPKMFMEPNLEHVLQEGRYLYVLDRACLQFDPDSPHYKRVCDRTYDFIAQRGHYDELRSTRHFGPMTFHLTYNNKVEGLVVDMIQRDLLQDAGDVVRLHNIMHPDTKSAEHRKTVYHISNEELIQMFADDDTPHGGPIQLALQAYIDAMNNKSDVA